MTQWNQNGDHPEDKSIEMIDFEGETFLSEGKVVRRFRHPDVPDSKVCEHCNKKMYVHGWIESGHIVCPGDYIMKDSKGYYPCKEVRC